MKYNRFLPLLVPLLSVILFELFIARPHLVYVVIILVILLFLFVVRQFLLSRAKPEKWWNVIIQPFVFFLGTISFTALIPSKSLLHILVVFFGIFIYLYFRTLYFYLVRPSKKNRLSLENLSSYGNFLAFYFIAASVYGFQAFLSFPIWSLMLLLMILTAMIIYQVFWANEIDLKKSLIYIVLGCLALIELAWSISFLTLSFYILGLILAVSYYVLIGLTRFYLLGKLNKSIIQKYLIFGLASILIVLFTSRWI